MASQVYTASTSAELMSLLQSHPEGGIEIQLKPGQYSLTLSKWSGADITYDAPITIASADPNNPAVFTKLSLANASNLTFDNLVFDMTVPTGKASTTYYVFSISDSSKITISNSMFDGDLASGVSVDQNGYGTGIGLRIIRVDGVTIANNEFTTFFTGITVNDSTNVTLSGNNIHSMANDGINISQVQGLLIENSSLHDFNVSPDSAYHHDMIQFYTTGTTEPTTDVIIRGNVIDIGDGQWTQSIFLHNELAAAGSVGTSMYYQNILIEDNTIYNSHLHGVYVAYADGLVIRNNTMVQVADSSVDTSANPGLWVPGIAVGSESIDVTIVDNVTGSIATTSGKGTWSVDGNVIIQNTNPSAANFYEDVFLTSSMVADENGYHTWIVTPGSVIATTGAGSSAQLLDSTANGGEATFDITMGDNATHTLVFDASSSLSSSGALLDDGTTTFVWDFGDGTTATGVLVQHSYADTGSYDVTLTVTTADGSTDTAIATARITSDEIAHYDVSTGAFTADRYGETVVLVDPVGDTVLDLGAKGAVATISRDDLGAFFGASEFSMSMVLESGGEANDYGEIARLHNTFVLSVDKTGALVFQMTTSDGTLKLTSTGVNMLDGAEHEITVNYDSDAALLEIVADGTVAASGALTGTVPPRASWGLSLGNPWGSQNFDGSLSQFSLDVLGQSYYETYTGDLSSVPDGTGPQYDQLVDLATILAGTGDEALTLSGSGVQASYSRLMLTSLYGAPGFDLSLSIQSDGSTANSGNVVMFYKMFELQVDSKGNLVALITTEDGSWTVKSAGVNMNDGALHDVDVSYDNDKGLVQVVVDGEMVGSGTATGDLIGSGSWDLNFGNPWTGKSFASTITAFNLEAIGHTATEVVSASEMPVFDDYVLDILAASGGEDSIVLTGAGSSKSLSGTSVFAQSDRIGVSLDFTRAEADGSSGVLVSSAGNLIVSVEGDGIVVKTYNATGHVVNFQSYGLDLNSTDSNSLVVLLDTKSDHLQVIVNDHLVIDDSGTDFAFTRGLGQTWYIGSPWGGSLDGAVTDFRLDDDFTFVTPHTSLDQVLV